MGSGGFPREARRSQLVENGSALVFETISSPKMSFDKCTATILKMKLRTFQVYGTTSSWVTRGLVAPPGGGGLFVRSGVVQNGGILSGMAGFHHKP